VSGGQTITITGTNFVAGATVAITQGAGVAPVAATNVKVVSATRITAKTGGGAAVGTFDVLVTTSAGTSSATPADHYTYGAPRPTVSAVKPATGPITGGHKITVTGTGFILGATVVIGQPKGATAIACTSVKVVSSTEITAVTGGGAQAGSFPLTVTTTGGSSASAPGDVYKYKV